MKVTDSYSNDVMRYTAAYTNKADIIARKKPENLPQYLKNLQRKFSYMTLCADRKMNMQQSSRTLTVHPDLIRNMQQDPLKEAAYTQHLKSIENLCKWIDGLHKVRGYTAKFHHWYIDENGRSCHFAQYERTDKTSEKLRAARQKNTQALITKTRKNSAEKSRKLKESLQKKKAAKAGGSAQKQQKTGLYFNVRI